MAAGSDANIFKASVFSYTLPDSEIKICNGDQDEGKQPGEPFNLGWAEIGHICLLEGLGLLVDSERAREWYFYSDGAERSSKADHSGS